MEYRAYLRRNPRDAAAMVGLGRNALQGGDIEGAARDFASALEVDPRQADAIKELAQIDIRAGRFDQARRRLERLTQIEPFDHFVRYSYAQALKLAGEPEKAAHRVGACDADARRAGPARPAPVHHPQESRRPGLAMRGRPVDAHPRPRRRGPEVGQRDPRADPRHAPTHQALAEHYAANGNPGLANYHRTMASGGPGGR